MQRSEIEDEISRLIGDPQHDRWSLTTIDSRIEFAQQEIQALTGAVKTIETLTPTADTFEVTLTNTVLDITRATLTDSDGEITVLEGRSREDLDFYEPNWLNQGAGKPRQFSYDASNKQIILIPKPSSTYAITDALKVWEVNVPAALSLSTSQPFDANTLMQAYSMGICYWVAAQCWLDDGTPEALSKAKFYRSNNMDNPGEYEKVLKKINSKFNSPTAIPDRIKWSPQGGRIGSGKWPTKSNPLW